MSNLLTAVLGSNSNGVNYFLGQWWILGLFFIIIIVLYLNSKGINSDYLIVLAGIGSVLMMISGVFNFPSDYSYLFYIVTTLIGSITFYYFISK